MTWSITAETLPAGVVLDGSTAVISGTAAAADKPTLTFQVTDGMGGQAQKNLTLTIK